MRKGCPKCGFPNPEEATVCECGYKFAADGRDIRGPGWELRSGEADGSSPGYKSLRGSGRGAAFGAVFGAILRPAVALAFLQIDDRPRRHGVPFEEIAVPLALLFVAVDGLWIGAMAGATANPFLGAAVGCLLSMGTCALVLRQAVVWFWVWVVLMGLAGAIAGGVGGSIGWRAKRSDAWQPPETLEE